MEAHVLSHLALDPVWPATEHADLCALLLPTPKAHAAKDAERRALVAAAAARRRQLCDALGAKQLDRALEAMEAYLGQLAFFMPLAKPLQPGETRRAQLLIGLCTAWKACFDDHIESVSGVRGELRAALVAYATLILHRARRAQAARPARSDDLAAWALHVAAELERAGGVLRFASECAMEWAREGDAEAEGSLARRAMWARPGGDALQTLERAVLVHAQTHRALHAAYAVAMPGESRMALSLAEGALLSLHELCANEAGFDAPWPDGFARALLGLVYHVRGSAAQLKRREAESIANLRLCRQVLEPLCERFGVGTSRAPWARLEHEQSGVAVGAMWHHSLHEWAMGARSPVPAEAQLARASTRSNLFSCLLVESAPYQLARTKGAVTEVLDMIQEQKAALLTDEGTAATWRHGTARDTLLRTPSSETNAARLNEITTVAGWKYGIERLKARHHKVAITVEEEVSASSSEDHLLDVESPTDCSTEVVESSRRHSSEARGKASMKAASPKLPRESSTSSLQALLAARRVTFVKGMQEQEGETQLEPTFLSAIKGLDEDMLPEVPEGTSWATSKEQRRQRVHRCSVRDGEGNDCTALGVAPAMRGDYMVLHKGRKKEVSPGGAQRGPSEPSPAPYFVRYDPELGSAERVYATKSGLRTTSSATLAQAEPATAPCALCDKRFLPENLPGKVTRKAISRLRQLWGVRELQLSKRTTVPAFMYSTEAVCVFCEQLFSAQALQHQEARQAGPRALRKLEAKRHVCPEDIAVERMILRSIQVLVERKFEELSEAEKEGIVVSKADMQPDPKGVSILTFRRVAQQSSVMGDAPSFGAIGALDGAHDTFAQTKIEDQPWWQVCIGQISSLALVRLWTGEQALCARPIWILASRTPFESTMSLKQAIEHADCSRRFEYTSKIMEWAPRDETTRREHRVRYVRVQLERAGALKLQNVQIFGTPVLASSPTAKPLQVEAFPEEPAEDTRSELLPRYLSIEPAVKEALQSFKFSLARMLSEDEQRDFRSVCSLLQRAPPSKSKVDNQRAPSQEPSQAPRGGKGIPGIVQQCTRAYDRLHTMRRLVGVLEKHLTMALRQRLQVCEDLRGYEDKVRSDTSQCAAPTIEDIAAWQMARLRTCFAMASKSSNRKAVVAAQSPPRSPASPPAQNRLEREEADEAAGNSPLASARHKLASNQSLWVLHRAPSSRGADHVPLLHSPTSPPRLVKALTSRFGGKSTAPDLAAVAPSKTSEQPQDDLSLEAVPSRDVGELFRYKKPGFRFVEDVILLSDAFATKELHLASELYSHVPHIQKHGMDWVAFLLFLLCMDQLPAMQRRVLRGGSAAEEEAEGLADANARQEASNADAKERDDVTSRRRSSAALPAAKVRPSSALPRAKRPLSALSGAPTRSAPASRKDSIAESDARRLRPASAALLRSETKHRLWHVGNLMAIRRSEEQRQLQKDRLKETLQRPSLDESERRTVGLAERKRTCALCKLKFKDADMGGKVTRRAVAALRSEWSETHEHVMRLGLEVRRDPRHASCGAMYDVVPVCLFCHQFFEGRVTGSHPRSEHEAMPASFLRPHVIVSRARRKAIAPKGADQLEGQDGKRRSQVTIMRKRPTTAPAARSRSIVTGLHALRSSKRNFKHRARKSLHKRNEALSKDKHAGDEEALDPDVRAAVAAAVNHRPKRVASVRVPDDAAVRAYAERFGVKLDDVAEAVTEQYSRAGGAGDDKQRASLWYGRLHGVEVFPDRTAAKGGGTLEATLIPSRQTAAKPPTWRDLSREAKIAHLAAVRLQRTVRGRLGVIKTNALRHKRLLDELQMKERARLDRDSKRLLQDMDHFLCAAFKERESERMHQYKDHARLYHRF